jgi:tRNA(fMet)-specific endonuclease VapC
MYLLDTNVCIAVINGTPRDVYERFDSVAELGVDLCVSSVSVFELSYGVEKSARRELNATRLRTFLSGAVEELPFEVEDAARAGEVRALLEKKGTPIGPYDTLIAGQALARGLVLVTHNVTEFARVEGLRVEDWQG